MKFGIILQITILTAVLIMAIDWYFFIKRLNKKRDKHKKEFNSIVNKIQVGNNEQQ